MIKKRLVSFWGCYFAVLSTIGYGVQSREEIDLRRYEKRLISQYGEDGVLQKIFKTIGVTNKYYVEFGAGSGHFCSNTKYFREKLGWTGLLLEGSNQDLTLNLHKEFITAENICSLFKKYNVPQEFDLISIDIDRNDFYVWKALSAFYRPRVVVIEFNSAFNPTQDRVIKYDAHAYENTTYFGASILAFYKLGRKLGYSLVYQELAGVNLFFIRDDVIEAAGVRFKNMNDVGKLYTPSFLAGLQKFVPQKVQNSLFVSSAEILG